MEEYYKLSFKKILEKKTPKSLIIPALPGKPGTPSLPGIPGLPEIPGVPFSPIIPFAPKNQTC